MKGTGDQVRARAFLNRALETWKGADPELKPSQEAPAALATS